MGRMSDLIALGERRVAARDQLLAAAQTLLAEHTAGSLTIRQITNAAGMPYGSFYTHFSSVDALIADLARLIFTSQEILVDRLKHAIPGPAEAFATITRQTLRIVTDGPGYGRLLYDAGLPLDWFMSGMRGTMSADVSEGGRWGLFQIADPDVTISLVAGAIIGAALDLHRGVLQRADIERVTERLLRFLGVGAEDARRLAHAEMVFTPPPPLPLRWRDLEAIRREAVLQRG
jgi:AcrR family transcriptional regulator